MLSERFRKTDLACFSINSKLYVTFGPVKLQSEQDFFPPPCFFFFKKKKPQTTKPPIILEVLCRTSRVGNSGISSTCFKGKSRVAEALFATATCMVMVVDGTFDSSLEGRVGF